MGKLTFIRLIFEDVQMYLLFGHIIQNDIYK